MAGSCGERGQQKADVFEVDRSFSPGRVGQHVADQGQVADLVDKVGDRAFDARHREARDHHNVAGIQLSPAVDNVGSLRLALFAGDQTVRDWIDIAALMNSCRGRPAHHDSRGTHPLPCRQRGFGRHPGSEQVIQRSDRHPIEPVHAVLNRPH